MRAIWNDQVIADSENTVEFDGIIFFPAEDVVTNYLKVSMKKEMDEAKGERKYYSLEVDGERNNDAAWFYPSPKPAAEQIQGMLAFGNGVEVIDEHFRSGEEE